MLGIGGDREKDDLGVQKMMAVKMGRALYLNGENVRRAEIFTRGRGKQLGSSTPAIEL